MLISVAVFYKKRRPSMMTLLSKIRSPEDAVSAVQQIALRVSPDKLAETVTNAIAENASSLDADQMQRLSRLHREHGRRLDAAGYAVCLIWTCVTVAGIEDDSLTFA